MKLFDTEKKDGATSNEYTRDGIIHCTFKDKHVLVSLDYLPLTLRSILGREPDYVLVSSPDDLFQLEINVDLEALGLKDLK